ncbi:MAG: hypothetical protein K8S21_00740 [Gemmatimonadetes bacterium]|nr:hypothetical protein [Gemmatimonadota bacterium]
MPIVLAAILALGLLASLALFDAVLEWRVAGLADDQVLARAAAVEGTDAVADPPDLGGLCVRPPLAWEERVGTTAGGGRFRVRWQHLGDGLVRAEVEGTGRIGARSRVIALVRPDSSERASGLFRCPSAVRLVPAAPQWLETHPEG